ncbi:MAG: hypothetical protein QM572_00115 [Nocardioides sp.]|uniref:hypothetical protein n=1 Tax=Nocardioides sp. TaxID=35761 RepID=UPI0039E72A4D
MSDVEADGRLGWFGGCPTCRARWAGSVAAIVPGEPRLLGDSIAAQGEILLCGVCGTYWLNDGYHPCTISAEEAQRYLADL